MNLPEEYGGGGAGMYELSLVMEDGRRRRSAAADGGVRPSTEPSLPPGTDDQKKRWLPGTPTADHGVRHHRARRRLQLTQITPPRRDGSDWITAPESSYFWHRLQAQAYGPQRGSQTGKLRPALFVVPTELWVQPAISIRWRLVAPNVSSRFSRRRPVTRRCAVGAEDAR